MSTTNYIYTLFRCSDGLKISQGLYSSQEKAMSAAKWINTGDWRKRDYISVNRVPVDVKGQAEEIAIVNKDGTII